MSFGITGHQRLRESGAWTWVRRELRRVLASAPCPLVGVSSLAVGADQVFAELIIELHGALEVVLPFTDYESTIVDSAGRKSFSALLKHANRIEVLKPADPTAAEDAYFAAGKRVVDLAETLIAIWDGKPAAGLGGTGDVVQYAKSLNKQILVLDPIKRVIVAHRQ